MKLRDYLLKIIALMEETGGGRDIESDIEVFTCLDGIQCLQGVTKCKHWYDGEPHEERMGFEISFALIRKDAEATDPQGRQFWIVAPVELEEEGKQ